jgi:hypothetical protein
MAFKDRVHSTEDALIYLTECTLATVGRLSMLKSRSKGEYERQIAIAQNAIVWITDFNIPVTGSIRVKDVIEDFSGNVKKWADQYDVLIINQTKK